jgi:hypothetical protein
MLSYTPWYESFECIIPSGELIRKIIPILPDTLTKNAGVAPEDVQYWTSILLSAFGAANLFTSRMPSPHHIHKLLTSLQHLQATWLIGPALDELPCCLVYMP